MSDKLSFEQFLEMFDSSLNDEQLAKFQKKLDALKQEKMDGAVDTIRELIDTYKIPFTQIVEIYDADSTQVDDFIKERTGKKQSNNDPKPERASAKKYLFTHPVTKETHIGDARQKPVRDWLKEFKKEELNPVLHA